VFEGRKRVGKEEQAKEAEEIKKKTYQLVT
jgi:hypothetical protein